MDSSTHHLEMITGLYAITPATSQSEQLYQQVEAALTGGAQVVQYRDKSLDSQRRRREASALLARCRAHGRLLIINDDVDLAVEIGADGVHLGREDGDIAAARRQLGPTALIGATCHQRLDWAEEAVAAGASHVAFGRFFASRSKPLAPAAPIELLRLARQRLRVPIVAIGGITLDNACTLIEAGADAIALIEGLFGSSDIHGRAAQLQQLFTDPQAPRP